MLNYVLFLNFGNINIINMNKAVLHSCRYLAKFSFVTLW